LYEIEIEIVGKVKQNEWVTIVKVKYRPSHFGRQFRTADADRKKDLVEI
jgi:hypothetical protein